VQAYAYTPYGARAAHSEDTKPNLFTFVGEFGVLDDGDGLYWMKRRWYDARCGCFLQRDPVGLLGGANSYAYAHQNPTTWIDPEGTFLIALGLAAIGILGAGAVIYYGLGAIETARGVAAQEKLRQDAIIAVGSTQMKDDTAFKVATRGKSGYGKNSETLGEVTNTVAQGAVEVGTNLLPGEKPIIEIGKNLFGNKVQDIYGNLGDVKIGSGTASVSQPIPSRSSCSKKNAQGTGRQK